MKVLVAAPLYPPEIGGPATHIQLLEEAFPKQHTETVVYPFARVRRYPKICRHIIYMCGLIKRMRGVSVVYALDPVSVGLPALIATRLLFKPFVLRVAGDYAWEQATQRFGVTLLLDEFQAARRTQPLMVRLLMWMQGFVARRATKVIVPSAYLMRIVEGWGVTHSRIVIVYNAFTPHTVTEGQESLRTALGYHGFVIASAGRLVPWKGFQTLIGVIADLQGEGIDIMAVIAGDGPDRETLEAFARERGVADRIRFLGRLPQEELARALKGADVFALNTGYEGFSHQLLEVMALEVPIVTTPSGGNTELIEHDVTGLLVLYDDRDALKGALRQLYQNPEVRVRLARTAQKRALSFTVPRMVEEIAAVLRDAQRNI